MHFMRCILSLIIIFITQAQLEAINQIPINVKKPTVCLNMIVKNESHVIKRCLESVLPLIDYWVICDTGSTDGTQQIIKDFMKSKNIPGELHEHEWVNFGHNREEALCLARFKADYLLFMDADDILEYEDDFKMPYLQHDCYMIRSKAGETEYLLNRIVKCSVNWHWKGVLHEYIYTENAKQCAVLPKVEYIYICDGARSRDPEKYLKDVKILTDALEKEPNNARYMFYLAQTYASAYQLDKAIECYTNRINMGGWEQEVFWSMMQVAYLKIAKSCDEKEVEDCMLRALKYRPTRPEPYVYLVGEARRKGDFEKGYEVGRAAIKMSITKDILFVEMKAYDALKLEFALCAWWTGHYQECYETTKELLGKNLTPEMREFVLEAHHVAQEKLEEKKLVEAIDDILTANSTHIN